MDQKENIAKLTSGPIGPTILKMTVPMIWGMLAMTVYNLIDTFYIGRLGTRPLAAIGFTFPVVMTVAGIALGLGMASSSLISRAIGRGDQREVQEITTSSLLLAFCLVGICVYFALLTITPLFKLLGAKIESLGLIRDYMNIWYIGMFFVLMPMIGNHAIRATGDTLTPGIIMVTGSILNAVLDPFLIFGLWFFPPMGMKGAALATVIARMVTFIASFSVLYFNKKMISFKVLRFRKMFILWLKILHIGIPAAGTFVILPFATGVITKFISSFGHEAVAAFGVASRIEGFVLGIFIALASVLGPFVGQNWGAKKYDRVFSAVQVSYIFSLIWGTVLFVALFFGREKIVAVFNNDPEVIRIASLYLLIVPISYGLQGIIYLANSIYNALGKPFLAVSFMIARSFLIYIPLAYIGKMTGGLPGIFFANCVSNFIIGGGAILLKRRRFLFLP